jgi:hypothetical protein
MDGPRHNPFATSFTRPGAIAYRFDSEAANSLETLVVRLGQLNWRAQIVGPHGSGKSTLVESLKPILTAHGRDLRFLRCTASGRQLTGDWRPVSWSPLTLVLVDGYEQLACGDRGKLALQVRRRAAGLLLTSHRVVWSPLLQIPVLWRTDNRLETVRAIVAHLLQQQGFPRDLLDQHVDEAWARAQGNVREVLFTLYDRMREHLQQT